MPPSAKRNQRTKRELPSTGIDDADTPNTSPSRPSKRKRTKDVVEETITPANKLPKNQAELDMSDEEVVTTVSQNLLMPTHFVQVAHDHDNALHQRQSKNVQAYAKITGKNWTFYVKRLRTNIGRPPEGFIPADDSPKTPAVSNEGVEVPAAPTEPSRIHLDLGPNKLVSRLHAEIFFDSETLRWNIIVNGRNGVKIDDQLLRRGQETKLSSGHVIEIGGVEMMFVLPENENKVEIHEKYLRRAGLIQPEPHDEISADSRHPGSLNDRWGSQGGSMRSHQGPLAIAPAPPDYRRPDTPIRNRSKAGAFSTSPAYAATGGTMMMNADQIDLSLDENQHIKPTYTYSQLISQAILESPDEQRTLNEIYTYCKKNYAFFRRVEHEKGWQNSIRHNLSLNNGFKLRARESHEPGKGGYWSFKADRREGLIADAWGGKGRRSPPKSSTPVSPGQHGRSAHGPGDANGGSPTRKVKQSPRPGSPSLGSYLSNGPHFTPDRAHQLSSSIHDRFPSDGSPLPRHRRPGAGILGLSDNVQGSPPVLSSSYAIEEGHSLITPAPVRKHPYLAPPSTAQRPSQHMPTSSPAPFWRYADLGNTPRGPTFDLSPTKDIFAAPLPPSSSPAPRRESVASPSKNSAAKIEMPDVEELQDEEPAFDLTKGFMSISKFHAASNTGVALGNAAKGKA